MIRRIFFAAALPLTVFAQIPEEKEICPNGKRHYRASVRHIERGGIGYEDGYTTFEAFLASDPSLWILTPFFDARGHIFDNGKWAANAGAGIRALWGTRAYGINVYYDFRNAGRLHANQIGAGLETLGERFDFRINGYLPVGAKLSDPYDTAFGFFSGHHMFLRQKFQSAMKGANAEGGVHFGKSESFDFYAAAGPYYFIGEIDPATWGGKARISGTYKDILTLEISDSYDRTFHNKFQGMISLTFAFGPKSNTKAQGRSCQLANTLNDRMLQPVERQEIIVVDNPKKNGVAIDPATGHPYYFVFVDNTSSSDGTYESPYHSFAQAQDNSSPYDILYVFPGDGTTTGMDSGIVLKANQKLWGSGNSHLIQTSQGAILIPPQSSLPPTITNTNVDTEGNAVTLASNNAISGFTISSAINDAIFGSDAHNLSISECAFENTTTFPVEGTFSGNADISIINNRFSNNANGVSLVLNGTSTVVCSNNLFENQTSVSNVPLEIAADSNILTALIENNNFTNNTTGSVRFGFNALVNADIRLLNNTIANNGTGAQSTLGSSVVIIPSGITENSSFLLSNNTFSGNTSNSFYMHTSGVFTNLAVMASSNTMSNNGGSAIVLATSVDHLTLSATDNTISGINDNAIATAGGTPFQTANITTSNNRISNITNSQSAIAISQGSSTLYFTAENNTIDNCEGTGIFCYSSEFTNMNANISGNTISNCQNQQGNAASGISLDTYVDLTATMANNTLSSNAAPGFAIGTFTSGNPNVCVTLTGNNNNINPGYTLINPGTGFFHLTPCNADTVNVGTISTSGTVDTVQSCSDPTPCPP